jgi:hypothetical protein
MNKEGRKKRYLLICDYKQDIMCVPGKQAKIRRIERHIKKKRNLISGALLNKAIFLVKVILKCIY